MENYGGIPLSEFTDRLKKVRIIMEDRGLDFLLMFSEPNGLISSTHGYIRYLTNWSSIVPSFLVLPIEGDATLLTSLSFEAKRAREVTLLKDVRAVGNFVKAIKILIKKGAEKIGLVGMDAVSNELYKDLRNKISVEFEDVSYIIDKLRMIKSPAEIELIRKSCRVCDLMFESLTDSILKGETVDLAVAKMEFEGKRAGAEISKSFITGPSADYPRYTLPMNLRFEDGYQITSGSYANYNGYWSQEIRMGAKGKPSKSRKDGYQVIMEAQEAAFSMMRPGILVTEVVEEMFNIISHAGYEAAIRVGHGIGLDYTERYISDCFQHPGVNKQLPKIKIEKNMVFEIHPNVWLDSREGFSAVGDVCLVNEMGVDVLTSFSRELFQC